MSAMKIDSGDVLESMCWCGREIVGIPIMLVGISTDSCGHPSCGPDCEVVETDSFDDPDPGATVAMLIDLDDRDRCLCGCRQEVNRKRHRRYRQGHDARLAAMLREADGAESLVCLIEGGISQVIPAREAMARTDQAVKRR